VTDTGSVDPAATAHEPSVDPWKGLRGIMAGTLILEAIVIGLVLTVIARVDDGEHFQPWKVWFVSLLAVAMVVASGLQRRPWAIPLNLTLAGLAVAGWAVHWSMGVCGLMFAAVWAYILYLRRDLSRRMAGGYLPSQHD
jgi:FtsH-binding integral membrane protein